MTTEQALELLRKLDKIAADYDYHQFGLPLVASLEFMDQTDGGDRACMKLIECVKAYVAELKP